MIDLPSSEHSYWREASHQSLYSQLHNDIHVDVTIVGAGITGLTTAYLLKQAGLSVAVLEKRNVGAGTTGRTTGKVSSQHNLIYADLTDRLGRQHAQIYGMANQTAITQVQKIIEAEAIDCNWQAEDHYVYTADSSQVAKLRKEAKVAAELGLPATFETIAPLPFEIKAAVKFSDQAKMHSIQYLTGLAAAIEGNGSYIFENSNAVRVHDGDPCKVTTRHGSIASRHIVIATNVPTLPLIGRGGYCLLEYPMESYIVAGKPDKKYLGMYISPDENHYSILPVEIEGERLLLIGGESHVSGARISKEAKYQKLADYGARHFGFKTVEYKWSDRDYLSYDSVPLVGKLYPWSKNIYVGTAFMKWGLTNGTVAAMILRDLITGQHNEWSDTFDSNRLEPVKSIPRVAAQHLLPWK